MKKILSLVLAALLMLCTLSFTVSAEDGTVAYVSFAGADSNDGLSAATPKKSWGTLEGSGIASVIKNGGTLVVVGKAYLGSSYSLPALSAPLTITAVYDGVDYKNPEPATSPSAGMFKMKGSAKLTINSDVTFDDIILFQENEQNTIVVPAGVTLTVTDKAVLMTAKDYHFKLVVEEGGKAILSKAAQETFAIENNGTVETYGGEEAPTTTVAPTEPATPAEPVAPASGVELKMTLNKTDYTVNGETKTMDVAPISGTMLPVRYVATALGATVDWDGATSTATLKTADVEIKITIGAATATVNGEAVTLDSPAFIENDRTYMPVQFVAEKLGATVNWDEATSTATITK